MIRRRHSGNGGMNTKEAPMVQRIRHFTGVARPGEPNDRPAAPAPPPPPRWRMWLLPAGLLITLLLLRLLSVNHTSSTPTENYSYSKFLSEVTGGDVRTTSVNPSGAITGTLKNGDNYISQIPTAISDDQLA